MMRGEILFYGILVVAGFGWVGAACAAEQGLAAFPGAQGPGALASGGRGGDVYYVTNLEDDGPGSLRYGVKTAQGPRTIVFAVGGTIELKSPMRFNRSHLTVAGQTAPGGGITLKGFEGRIEDCENVIVRFLRFRPGDINASPGGPTPDALWIRNARNVIVDHCSVSWGIDEQLSTTHNSDRVTVQWCLITEALHRSKHAKGDHGYGSLINGGAVAYHHNLYAHNRSRNPRPQRSGALRLEFAFVSNVLYNGGDRFGYCGEDDLVMNYIGNYLIAGPQTRIEEIQGRKEIFNAKSAKVRIYQRDNLADFNRNGRVDGVDYGWEVFTGEYTRLEEPVELPGIPITATDAARAYEQVLRYAGASLVRDAVDERIVRSVLEQTGAHIDSQGQVGGWPEIAGGEAPQDSDGDGMPDEWERARGLNPHDPADGARPTGSGYTNLEVYLNELAARAFPE